jgi:hypothetical protein
MFLCIKHDFYTFSLNMQFAYKHMFSFGGGALSPPFQGALKVHGSDERPTICFLRVSPTAAPVAFLYDSVLII